MSEKRYKLAPDEIRPLIPGLGGCFATDSITVDGRPVGYMYRDDPEEDWDSGWRFFSGFESEAAIDDPDYVGIYDVNTIANYDPDIIPWLEAPIGSAYSRDDQTGQFVEDEFPADDED